jgi:hypothetical protein
VKTEELIGELARSAAPVTPLPRPAVRFAGWAAAFVLFAAAAVLFFGARPALVSDFGRPTFAVLAALTIATCVLSAIAALRSSVPGLEAAALEQALPAVGALAWTTWLLALLFGGAVPTAGLLAFPVHAGCIARIFGISLLPAAALITMVRRAAPLNPVRSTWLSALASLALAAAAVQFICPIDDPAHHLESHLFPVVAFTAIAAAAAWRKDRLRSKK